MRCVVSSICAFLLSLCLSTLSWAQLQSPVAGFTRALPYYVLMLQDGSAYLKLVTPTSDYPNPQWIFIPPASFSGSKVVGVVAQSTSWGGYETILFATDAGYLCQYTPCCWPNLTQGITTCWGPIFEPGREDEVVDITLAPQSQPATNTVFVATKRGDLYQVVGVGNGFLGNPAGSGPTVTRLQSWGGLKTLYR